MGEFILFERTKYKSFQCPTVTITKNGQINFNKGTLLKFIQDKDYVVLYYNKTDNRIGFEFLSKESNNALKIRIGVEANLGLISARSFLRFYNIPFIETNKYRAEIDDETKFIVINLKKTKRKNG